MRASPFAATGAPGSLAHTLQQLRGIHTPFLYVSSAAAGAPYALHVEDCELYSLNYLHASAPKYSTGWSWRHTGACTSRSACGRTCASCEAGGGRAARSLCAT
jgi:hypothetical protein